MPFFTSNTAKTSADIHYQDFGSGDPVILIHGWPLSHRAWEKQVNPLIENGHRVIAYCRRGMGISSAPWEGYDYDTLTEDLRNLILELDLQNCTLVGFSMGGGEVARYFTNYAGDRVKKAVLISSIVPLVPQKPDNPDGVPQETLEQISQALVDDRPGFLRGWVEDYYNAKKTGTSQGQLDYTFTIASYSSPHGCRKAANSWASIDLRPDCKNFNVPTLIIHGDEDQIVPIKTAGDQAAALIPNNIYHIVKGGPHGNTVTHTEEVNRVLLDFLARP